MSGAPVSLFSTAPPGQPTALLAARCSACQRVYFPSAAACLACGAGTERQRLAGPATLTVHTSVLVQPPGSLVQAPYDVGVAAFPEGICVIGLLDGAARAGDLVQPVVLAPHPQLRTFGFRRTG
jgi:uncharacterized OB-fold protein